MKIMKSFIFVGLSIGTKIITLIPGAHLGLYLIFPLKKIKTLKKVIELIFMTFLGVLAAQPALLIPLPRIYNRVFSAISGSSAYDQEKFFLINFENYQAWIERLSLEHQVPALVFTLLFALSLILLVKNIYINSDEWESYFLFSSLIMIAFITLNVERTWNYYLFLPFLFMLIYLFRLNNFKNLNIFYGAIVLMISIGGLLLHNDKAVNSYFVIDQTKNLSFDKAIGYLDNKYAEIEYEYKQVYWDPDYYFLEKILITFLIF